MRRFVSSWSSYVFVHKRLHRSSLHSRASSQDRSLRRFTPIRRKPPSWIWNPQVWTRSYLVNPLILLCDTHPAASRRWILFDIYPVVFHWAKGKYVIQAYPTQMTQYSGLELHHFRSALPSDFPPRPEEPCSVKGTVPNCSAARSASPVTSTLILQRMCFFV